MTSISSAQNPNYEILLMEYAAGNLDLAQQAVIRAHLHFSALARDMVRHYEHLGGAVMEQYAEPIAMSINSLNNVLSMLDKQASSQHNTAHKNQDGASKNSDKKMQTPRALRELDLPQSLIDTIIAEKALQMRWRKERQGLRIAALPIDCQTSRTQIYKLGPGFYVARKQKPQPKPRPKIEITLVLKGGLHDEYGEYTRGDLRITESHDQSPESEACKQNGCVYVRVTPRDRKEPEPQNPWLALIDTLKR